jgi:23S rRNA (guanine745-N1)-methyltransferase
MVAARASLLAAGHLAFLRDAICEAAAGTLPPEPPGLVVDVGAGTGYYLAAVLDRLPSHLGVALDIAKPAVRAAARAHPRGSAAVCDIWRGLPLADQCADVVLDVFAPRNAAEFARVLRPGGAVIVVTPHADHLTELVRALDLIGIDPAKDQRLDQTVGRVLRLDRASTHGTTLSLSRDEAALVVGMGPSAWHLAPDELASRLAALGEPVRVTASVDLRVYRR